LGLDTVTLAIAASMSAQVYPIENTLPDAGLMSQFGSTVRVEELAARMNRDCPAPVPDVIQTMRLAQDPKPEPVSVFDVPPVAVPLAMPVSISMVEPLRTIAISQPSPRRLTIVVVWLIIYYSFNYTDS